MSIDDLKRALVEVKRICDSNPSVFCDGCDFSDKYGFCNLRGGPFNWDVDDWKEETHETD